MLQYPSKEKSQNLVFDTNNIILLKPGQGDEWKKRVTQKKDEPRLVQTASAVTIPCRNTYTFAHTFTHTRTH